MRIIKIALQNQIIGQDPNNPANDPNIAQQRMVAAQAAYNTLKEAAITIGELKTKVTDLEEDLGVTDGTIRKAMEQSVQMAVQQSESFIQLQRMNFIKSPMEIINQNVMSNINVMIMNQMQTPAPTQPQTAQAKSRKLPLTS